MHNEYLRILKLASYSQIFTHITAWTGDTQLYVSVPASESQAAAAKLVACIKALD